MSRWSEVIQSVAPLPDYMIIEGTRISAEDRDVIDVYDPGSGLRLCAVPAATADDVAAAVNAASTALKGPWAKIPPRQRSQLLWAVGTRIRENAKHLTLIETLETGKPLKEAQTSVERLAEGAEKLTLGHGLDNPDMGPLISNRQLQTVVGYVERAKSRGLNFVTGGNVVTINGCEGGHFFAPTIVNNVAPEDELAQEEIFGPVLSVIPVEDVEHAIEIANNTEYGLAAPANYVETKAISITI